MMERIWILFGNTGEYSDHIEWVVAAYTSQSDAEADAAALNARASGLETLDWSDRDHAVAARLKAHDPQAEYSQHSSTGIEYYVCESDLHKARRVPDEPEG